MNSEDQDALMDLMDMRPKPATVFLEGLAAAIAQRKDDLNRLLLSTDLMSPMFAITPAGSTMCPEDVEALHASLKRFQNDAVMICPPDMSVLPMGGVLAKLLIDLPGADKVAIVEAFMPHIRAWEHKESIRNEFMSPQERCEEKGVDLKALFIEMQKELEAEQAAIKEPVCSHPNASGLGNTDSTGRRFIRTNNTIFLPVEPASTVKEQLQALGFQWDYHVVDDPLALAQIPSGWRAEIWVPYTAKLTAPGGSRLYVFYADCEAQQAPKIVMFSKDGVPLWTS